MIQPLLVRPLPDGSYELVAGERRWRAARQAGLEKVPAVVRDSAQAERMQVALIENMVREDLNPVEEARACAALVDDLGLSKEDLARDAAKGGWSVRETENRVKLAGQPKRGDGSAKRLSAEESAAMREAADRFETALGHEVKVRQRGGEVAVEIRFEDLDEALALAKKLDRKRG